MGKKKRNNAEKKKKNTMAPSTSNPTVSADSSPSAAPPIEGGGAKEKKQESPVPAADAVSTSSERKSSQESPAAAAVSTSSERKSIQAPVNTPGLMFVTKPEPEPESDLFFLFEKKIDGAADLKQPAIEFCSDRLKMALQQTPDINVFTTDPTGRGYGLRFARHGGREGSSCYTIRPSWEKIVAENGVEEGDLVTGIGSILHFGIAMQLNLLKKNAEQDHRTTSSSLLENWIGEAFLLFEKKLEYEDSDEIFYPRLVIRSCKDVVKEAIDQKLGGKGLTAFLRVSAIDATGRTYSLRLSRYVAAQEWRCIVHHEWGGVIASNRLRIGDKVWCWGRFLPDGSIQMKIDVDRELKQWMTSTS